METLRARPEAENNASREEVAMAISALTDADFARLGQVSRLRARGLHQLEWSDLLHQAVERALDGSRRWPFAVPFPVFLREVIRSLASEARRVQNRMISGDGVSEALLTGLATDEPDPEEVAIGRDMFAALERLFAGDDVALGILRGLVDELSPAEIQTRLKIDQTHYDSARRRIRRRIAGTPEIFL